MPPKAAPTEHDVVLGKVKGSLKIGVVGLPNVGKSSFFNLLCGMSVPAENFPFCTIDPTTSRVAVPDERFDWLVQHFKPASVMPSYLNVTDIAGLVKGAHEGQGLGNAFLSHIRAVDGIFHVMRAFDDDEIVHVEGNIDPVRDLSIISNELIMKDLVQARKSVEDLNKPRAAKPQKGEQEALQKALDLLESGREIRCGDWKAGEIDFINNEMFLTAKPVIYLVNLSEPDFIRKRNKWLPKIKAWVDEHETNPILIPFSVAFETKWLGMDADARAALEAETKATTMMPKIIKTGYHALNLIHFFTSGTDEVRAWPVHRYTKAPQAAGTIHTDFEKGFVVAEVIKFDDFKVEQSEAACRSAGKLTLGGKNYVVQDGDIMHIKANTSALGKKK